MTPNEYIEAAIRTGGYRSKFYGNKVPLLAYQFWMKEFVKVGDKLDKIKKSLFYGKDNTFAFTRGTLEGLRDQKLIDVIHAILGICTESVELVEALQKPTLDEVNIKEELGDVLWYVAICCKTLDCTFEELMETNIAKLKARFPERFNEHDALNRNLDNERKVLENGRSSS